MNEKKHSTVKRILGTRGMGAVITAFAGLIIIYVAFGLIVLCVRGHETYGYSKFLCSFLSALI